MIKISEEVKQALKNNRPIVALESTIISPGMPYPKNVETALRVEEVVRKTGAVPATIGIIDGDFIIGLTPQQIEEFGKRQGVVKVSRRDLSIVQTKKMWGATTVATTMILAQMAGIKVFATGGIGGVHRGAETSFDVSADLQELANTDVLVVCAGAKAILDLPKTLEYLETYGVPVLGYKTEYLPSFYSRTSNLKVDYNIETPHEFASIMKNKWDAKLKGGILVTNPIDEKYSLDNDYINEIIEEGIKEMNNLKIIGKDTTPFLLSYVKEKTNGVSLESNIQLVLSNAKLAGKIAIEYSLLKS